MLARRAAEFELPIDGLARRRRTLLPAVAEPLRAADAGPLRRHEAFRALIVEGGAEPVVEHGVLFGEVRGLEVCRVVDDPDTGATRLEVGVGAHDREAFQMLHGDVPDRRVAGADRRRSSLPSGSSVRRPHPLNRLAAERFLRWRLEQDPTLVGAASLSLRRRRCRGRT